ncbi:MAG: hypothetical protein JWR26_162 [Pedosphaera sp.]|nr:hypothetical protein [Pedosphaera sp.]
MKKPPDSDKTGNEGIQRTRLKMVQATGLILLFDGEVAAYERPDERRQTGILTSGLEPRSRLPGL